MPSDKTNRWVVYYLLRLILGTERIATLGYIYDQFLERFHFNQISKNALNNHLLRLNRLGLLVRFEIDSNVYYAFPEILDSLNLSLFEKVEGQKIYIVK